MFSFFKKKSSDPTDISAAVRYFKKGDFAEALRRADAIIASNPEVAQSHRFKGEVLFEMGRYQDCLKPFKRAEELGGPGTEEIFFWRALAFANAGEPRTAIEILERYVNAPGAAPDLSAKCRSAIEQLQS